MDDLERFGLERVRALGAGTVIDYAGMDGDGSKDPSFAIHFTVGGERLTVRGTDEASRRITGGIRDTCYYATSGLTYLGTVEVDGSMGYRFAGTHCARCGSPVVTRTACEWRVCDACAETCTHEYKRGLIHGGGVDLGIGNFCRSCGRGKPDEPDLPLSVHHELVKAKLWERGVNATFLS